MFQMSESDPEITADYSELIREQQQLLIQQELLEQIVAQNLYDQIYDEFYHQEWNETEDELHYENSGPAIAG